MIKLLEFFAAYNNFIKKKKKIKKIKHTKKVEDVLNILIKINIISWYNIKLENNKKIIIMKLNKFKKITPLWTQQKITMTKKEIQRLNNISKIFLIISNNEGLHLIDPFKKPKFGGLLVAKIQL